MFGKWWDALQHYMKRLELGDDTAWEGLVKVTIRDERTGLCRVETFKNLITDDGRALLRGALEGLNTDVKIKYIALGSGTNAPTNGDHTLQSEQFRKAITQYTDANTPGSGLTAGQLISTCYFASYEAATFTTNELGWFAGPLATSSVNSGILVARTLWTHAKSAQESLQVDRTDSLG